MTLAEQFVRDRQGRRYADLLNDPRIPFPAVLAFFDDPDRQRRMEESELHHDRPALAGVVRELEQRDDLTEFFGATAGHATTRFRQAVGVVVRIVMEGRGWRKTGRRGSLGVPAGPDPDVLMQGARPNAGGLSVWFTRAERYELAAGSPFRPVEQRAAEIVLKYGLLSFGDPPPQA
jgi:hypothetical protein